MRDNGGGLITMADGIPQFFVKDFVNPGFRSLVCPINEYIFKHAFSPNDPYVFYQLLIMEICDCLLQR